MYIILFMQSKNSGKKPGSRARVWSSTIAASTALLGLVGCAPFVQQGAPGCMPPKYGVDSASVKAGGTLTVSAQDATCDPRYGPDAQIELALMDSAGNVFYSVRGPMSDAGAFALKIKVPSSVMPGEYGISAMPYDIDWCDDTGKNNRVSNPGETGPGELIERASCAMPFLPVVVTA